MNTLLHDLTSQIANFSRQNVTVENGYSFHNIHHCSVQITSLIIARRHSTDNTEIPILHALFLLHFCH